MSSTPSDPTIPIQISPIFWDETWFYPILIQYTSQGTIFDLLQFLAIMAKTLNNETHPYVDFTLEEIMEKRLAIFLKFYPKYSNFDLFQMRFVLKAIGGLEDGFDNVLYDVKKVRI